jgi:signal transduction histidine kinase
MTSQQRRLAGPALAVLGFVGYFLLARLGEPLAEPGEASAFWPPAGFLVTLALITGRRWWPWWLAGALAEVLRGTLRTDWALWRVGLALLAVASLPLASGTVTRWLNGNPPRMRTTSGRLKALLGSLTGCAISSVPGSIAFAGNWDWSIVREQMGIWFVGDVLAALIIPPLIVAVVEERQRFRSPAYCVELATHVGLTLAVSALVFWTKFPVMAVVIAPLVIAAYRMEVVGAAATLFASAMSVSLATAEGRGAFSVVVRDGYEPLPATQIFIACVGLTVLLLSSEIARVRALSELRREMAVIATQADESVRDEIAQGLHDGPIQTLSAVALRLETRAMATPVINAPVVDNVISDDVAVSQIRSAATTLRSLIFELAPGIKSAGELRSALEREASTRFSGTSTTWTVDVDEHTELRGSAGSTLYRVARESMANVLVHARATSVSITVRGTNTGVLIIVSDNGTGADESVFFRRRTGHRGLLVLRARVTSEGGWLDLDSAVGRGTEIKAWVPTVSPAAPVAVH